MLVVGSCLDEGVGIMLIHTRGTTILQDCHNVFDALGLGSHHEKPTLVGKRRRVCINDLVREMAIGKVRPKYIYTGHLEFTISRVSPHYNAGRKHRANCNGVHITRFLRPDSFIVNGAFEPCLCQSFVRALQILGVIEDPHND